MKQQNMIMIGLALVIVGGGSFFAGMKYQSSQTQSPVNQRFGNGQGGFRNGGQNPASRRMGGRQTVGEIINQDNKSITVKLQDGSSKIILISSKTTVVKTDTAAVADLKVGERVGIFGTDNTDGSVSAQNIQLNPIFRGPNPTPGSGR